jgi:hypothetical protein
MVRIRIRDPWGKKAPDPGSGSATLLPTGSTYSISTVYRTGIQNKIKTLKYPSLFFFGTS